MTFIRKFINILNMDNWKNNDDFQSRGIPNLYLIRQFWIENPQTRESIPYRDASTTDYLLYGKTLMLHAFGKCDALRTTGRYPFYFIAECRISNPLSLHQELIKEGYLGFPTIQELLYTYKVSELKIIAESIGCPKGGTKDILIQRIIENMDNKSILNFIKKTELYSLTEKGHFFLQDNWDLVELHRHQEYSISLSEFIAHRFVGNKKRTFYDNAFHIVSNRIYTNCVNRRYLNLVHDYRTLYDIAMFENRFSDALREYLSSLYLRTCCCHTASYMYYTETTFEHEVIFTNKTAAPIVELRDFYYSNMIDNIYNNLSFPCSFLSKKEFTLAITEMLNEIIFDYEKYNNIIRARLKKYSKIK